MENQHKINGYDTRETNISRAGSDYGITEICTRLVGSVIVSYLIVIALKSANFLPEDTKLLGIESATPITLIGALIFFALWFFLVEVPKATLKQRNEARDEVERLTNAAHLLLGKVWSVGRYNDKIPEITLHNIVDTFSRELSTYPISEKALLSYSYKLLPKNLEGSLNSSMGKWAFKLLESNGFITEKPNSPGHGILTKDGRQALDILEQRKGEVLKRN